MCMKITVFSPADSPVNWAEKVWWWSCVFGIHLSFQMCCGNICFIIHVDLSERCHLLFIMDNLSVDIGLFSSLFSLVGMCELWVVPLNNSQTV